MSRELVGRRRPGKWLLWLAIVAAAAPSTVCQVHGSSALAQGDGVGTFPRDGFVVVPGFASDDECDRMMRRMAELVDAWDPDSHEKSVFHTDENQTSAQGSDRYFLDSAEGIHFFLEPKAAETGPSPSPVVTKALSLNKVGHALHVLDPVFREYSHSTKVSDIVAKLGWQHPVVPQSMYIFKQPKIGGEVTPHQDSTFLFTTPRQTCLGLWLALEDATLENGCLWARPGSHQEPVRRHFARNPGYFVDQNFSEPMMIFEELAPVDETTGPAQRDASAPGPIQTPEDARARGFVPLPVRKGSLVAIHGELDHLSFENVSPKSRHTFQLHLIEGPIAGVTWSPRNWLQYGGGGGGFPHLGLGQDM